MKNLFKSLAAFQQEVPTIHEGTKGYGYSYSSLPEIFRVINPILKKHGLGFTQLIEGTTVRTIVFHLESGEQLECSTQIPQGVTLKGMNDFQVLGSAITYIRRYALSAALGLVTDKDADTSTHKASNDSQKGNANKNSAPTKPAMKLDSPLFKSAVKKIKAGTTTLEQVSGACTISESVLEELKKQINESH
jgi:hypothetical protein